MRNSGREGQPERRHLLAVANQQDVANQYRVVPRLALDRRESRELSELVWAGCDERQLTFFRQHQQQVLVRQQRLNQASRFQASCPISSQAQLAWNLLVGIFSKFEFRLIGCLFFREDSGKGLAKYRCQVVRLEV